MARRREPVNTGEPIAAYIGRCVDCKKVYRWDVPVEVRISNPHIMPGTGNRNSAAEALTHAAPRCVHGVDWRGRPELYWIRFRPLVATVEVGVRCTRICRNATSAACECECGGTNHGHSHAVRGPGGAL